MGSYLISMPLGTEDVGMEEDGGTHALASWTMSRRIGGLPSFSSRRIRFG